MRCIPLTLCLSLMFAPVFAYAAGPLTPPGSPAPTMKTLDELEPRIPIPTLISPVTYIGSPGSYYLTQNRIGGILQIGSSDVTIDLNGFRLEGTGSDAGVWVIQGTTQLSNVTIKNGTITGYDRGVQFSNVVNSEISDLKIENCDTGGITLSSDSANNSGNVIRRCSIRDCGSGISLSGLKCRGNRVEKCTIMGSTLDGILLLGEGTLTGNRILHCEVSDSAKSGIKLTANAASVVGLVKGNEIRDCVISSAGEKGILLTATGVGTGCDGNVIRDCVISDTGAEGIQSSTSLANATCDGNVVQSCTVRNATGSGIRAANTKYGRIDGNHISLVTGAGSHGLFVSGSKNFVVRNTCGGANDNIDIAATNTYGPEVNASGALANTGDASHPLANFNLQ